ncbi:hypothetical protein [Serratia fonticola]|nr:hypothetical protein [Serratia fonticola]
MNNEAWFLLFMAIMIIGRTRANSSINHTRRGVSKHAKALAEWALWLNWQDMLQTIIVVVYYLQLWRKFPHNRSVNPNEYSRVLSREWESNEGKYFR